MTLRQEVDSANSDSENVSGHLQIKNGFGDIGKASGLKAVFLTILIPLLLFTATFAEAIFANGAFTISGLYNGLRPGYWEELTVKKVMFWNPPYRIFTDNLNDYGGSMWQSEPGALYTKNTLLHLDSPYWNPYSACGSFGVQTVADIKLSVQSILIAVLGGSQNAFHIVFLGTALLGVIALFVVLNGYFAISILGSTLGCAAFLLNGYAQTNLFLNPQQNYFLAPIVLLSAVRFCKLPTRMRFGILTLANVVVLTNTFIPTTVLILFGCNAMAFGLAMNQRFKVAAKTLLLQVLSGALAVCILAVIYLPVAEAFMSVDDVSRYNSRTFPANNFYRVLSLYTPNHFWEEYTASNLDRGATDVTAKTHGGWECFHNGIVPMLLAGSGLCLSRMIWPVRIGIGLLFFSFSRVFGCPGLSVIYDHLPFFKGIVNQYWYCLISLVFVVVISAGFDLACSRSRKSLVGTAASAALFAAAATFLYFNYGIVATKAAPDIGIIKGYLVKDALLFLGGLVLLVGIKLVPLRSVPAFRALILCLCLFELGSYVIHYRCERSEVFRHPPYSIRFIRSKIGEGRVACFGNYLLPPEYGSAFQLPQIEALEMNGIPSYYKFFERNFLPTQDVRWGFFPTLQIVHPDTAFNKIALDALAVKYIVVPNYLMQHYVALQKSGCVDVIPRKFTHVFENPDAFPRVFAVHHVVSGATDWENESGLRQSVYTTDAQLLKEAAAAGISVGGKAASTGVEIGKLSRYRNAEVHADVDLNEPAVLVLMDTYHPCWTATDNGRTVHIGKANDTFRAIVLSAGHHHVEMKFEPKSYRLAVCISLLGVLTLLLVMFGRSWRLISKMQPAVS